MSFLAFFALAGDLGASSVFDRRPKRNPSFLYTRRLRNPPKGSSEESLKTDPEKDIKMLVLGGQFWLPFLSLGQLLALSWGTLLLSFCLLVPRASKREVQERPRAAQELPKGLEEFQERPRGSQESPGEFQNRPKTAPIFRKRGSSARIITTATANTTATTTTACYQLATTTLYFEYYLR